MRCEGWRRSGGAFTLGLPQWVQCENDATVMLTIEQEKVTETLPACKKCWQEAIDKKIKILGVVPIIDSQ